MKTKDEWAAAIVDSLILEGGGQKGAAAAAQLHGVSERSIWRKRRQLSTDEELAVFVSIKIKDLRPPTSPSVAQVLESARIALHTVSQVLAATANHVGNQLQQGTLPYPEQLIAIARLTDSTTELYQTLAGLDMARENSQQYLEILRQVYTKERPKELVWPA